MPIRGAESTCRRRLQSNYTEILMTECPRRPSARYQSALNESFVSEGGVAQPHGAHPPLLEVEGVRSSITVLEGKVGEWWGGVLASGRMLVTCFIFYYYLHHRFLKDALHFDVSFSELVLDLLILSAGASARGH